MLLNWSKYRRKVESKNPKFAKEIKGKATILLKCTKWDSKKLRFINERKANGLLSKELKIALGNTPLLDEFLF